MLVRRASRTVGLVAWTARQYDLHHRRVGRLGRGRTMGDGPVKQWRSITLILATVLTVAACGASGSSPAPSGAGGGGGGANPTQAAGGGGGNTGSKPAGWDKFGKVSYAISGGVSASGELGFVPAGSIFGGPTNSSLSFFIESTDTVLILRFDPTATILQFGDSGITVPSAECKMSNLKLDNSGGSGSFECTKAMGMNKNGAVFTDVKATGSFTAKPS